jgi:Co/Zn/Cd efflux system component
MSPSPNKECQTVSGCGCEETRFDGVSSAYRRALILVIAINAGMFLVEMTAGAIGRSQALKADALDFAGDAATYALSLAVIGASLSVRTTASLFKGASLAAFALVVLATTALRFFDGATPEAPIMSGVGALALAANVASVFILLRWRDGDSNVRSVWLCSRNDAIGNIAVIAAGVAVFATGSRLPDLVVAMALASLFMSSSVQIIRQALAERRSLLWSRPENDDRGPDEGDDGADEIPAIRRVTLDEPEPKERGGDVDAAISRIGASGERRIDQGEEPREQRERCKARRDPESRLVEAEPGPESEATSDFGERGEGVDGNRFQHV